MNWKKIFTITFLILVLFSFVSVASANDDIDCANATETGNLNILNLADENEVLEASESFTQLDRTIRDASSGATLVLDRDYVYTQGDKSDGITINKDITIDGRGHSINGAGQASIFKISGNRHVTLKDIMFINAYGTNGAAVSWTSGDSVNIINSTFINNIASGNGGAIYISSSSSTVTFNSDIINSVFANNKASNGGAIYATGTVLDIMASRFSNDAASVNGGSILLDSGACMSDCVFVNSSAGRNGGGIYVNSHIIDFSFLPPEFRDKVGIFNSRMISCRAENDGGAGYVYVNGGTVGNVTVINCTAGRDGGAGYIDGNGGSLVNSTLINNSASRNGGAILWAGINGTVYGTTFINNTAKLGNGGALYSCPDLIVGVFDGISFINCSTFINNTARDSGGAIYCSGIFTAVFNSYFTGDKAYNGAGIYLDVGAAIENCTFIKEVATYNGGAVYLYASNPDVHDYIAQHPLFEYLGTSDSVFVGCSAGNDGGAAYLNGNYGFVHNVILANNTAGHDGGGAYVAGNGGSLYNSSFINNHAGRDGGAVAWAGSNGTVINITCIYNSVGGGSGSFCIHGSNLTVKDSVFSYSNSTLSGGAVYVHGDNVNITNSLFEKCSSGTQNGGAVAIDGYHTHINYCNFTQNRVNIGTGRGGAIYLQGNRTHIWGCNFERCTAFEGGFVFIDGPDAEIDGAFGDFSFAVEGGAFYVNGDYATISNTNMSYNNATTYAGAIYVAGDFATIDHVEFIRCISYNNGAGAIYIKGLNTTISNSFFVENRVSGMEARGGSINVQGDYTRILNSTFDKCTASDGGVIFVNGSYTLIDGYSCMHSMAFNNGGALYIEGDHVTVCNFNISLTNATNYGGAIYIEGDHAHVYNSNFTRCIADNYHGGALYVAGLNVTISNSTFVQNRVNPQSGRGGSIEVQGNDTTIYNCTFDMCNAYEGGIIYINGSNTVIDGFTSTHCITFGDGGAIYVAGDNAVFYDFDIAMTNATGDGGAIYVAGDNVKIFNGLLELCVAVQGDGGSIYVAGFNTTIDDCDFERTQGFNGNGGAIYVAGLNTTIYNSVFSQNRVNSEFGHGGSIKVHGDDTAIYNCTFDMCNAYEGGIIYINGSNTVIDGFTSLHCIAFGDGGAIYVAGDNAVFYDFDIAMTNATDNGGAIYVAGDNAFIHDGIVELCVVNQGNGGSIYVAGFNTTVDKCTFNRSMALNGNGGAIYVAGLNASVFNSMFIQNKVNTDYGRGGSIEVQGNDTAIYNCTFDMCDAYEGGIIYINGSNTLIDGFVSLHCFSLNDGGAIYVAGHNAVFADFDIAFSNATNNGGAIYVAGDNVTINNGIVDSSIVGVGSGGAIYVAGFNTTVDNCTFDKTQARNGNGGAIFVEGDYASVENSNFMHSFSNNGGIIYIVGHDVLVDNSNFTFSWAGESGGSIYVEGHDAVISNSNFRFTNASSKDSPYAGYGGAIYVFGDNVNITSSTFFKTIAEMGGNGGAIYILGENVTISKSNFTDTTAPDYFEQGGGASAAGAISIAGSYATVEESNFNYCHARNAGAMFIAGTNTRIINSKLTDCFSDGDGGAIYIFGEYTNISGTLFDDCHCSDEGGAIFILFGEYTNIQNSTFLKCYSNAGGAINVEGDSTSISDSDIIECYAVSDGGAIYISGNNITMNGTDFTDCYTVNNNGGAIYWIGTVGLVNNSNFVNNTSPKLGGAIFMKENAKITFQNSKFTNNTAGINGGAIDFNRGAHDEIIINSTFENNLANRSAGAVFWFGTNGTIRDSTFINNRALGIVNYTDSYGNITYGGYGGAVMWTGAQGVVDNCTFINNYAQYNEATKSGGRGGAVYLQGSDVGNGHDTAFYNSIFINNTAGYNGGAVDWFRGAANGRVENSTFINNTAHRSGGGIYWSGVNGTIKHATFINNTALGEITDANGGGDGGAVLWVGPEGMIQTVNFTNNRAAYSGGAIFLKGTDNGTAGNCSNVFIDEGVFADNFAGLNGGAITFQRGAMNGTLSNSVFNNNTASRNGGALFWYGHNGTVMACNFTNNQALGLVDTDARGVHQYIDENGNPVLGGSGGAIAWVRDVGNVDDSNFINNTAKRLGGAVFLRDNSFTVFNGDYFANNTAGINGGAIDFNRGAHDGAIINSTFENNLANRSAGAVFWFGTNGTIRDSTFINNTALGIVNYTDSYGNITYGGYGGAVMWTGAQGIIDNSVFIANEAKYNSATKSGGRGGAVYLQGSDVGLCMNTTFSNSLFIDNTAGFNGGAIAWFRGARNGHVENSTFINNTAQRSGGAISWTGVNGTVEKSTFINNAALGSLTDKNGGGDGGAILWVGHDGTIAESKFSLNNASYSGGAIFLKGSDDGSQANCSNVSIRDSLFEDNFAGLNGGAITFQRGAINGLLSNSTLISNTALRNGGALFWYGHNGTVTGCDFKDNAALGLVDEDARGVHTYIDGDGNKVPGGSGGAVAWTGDIGSVNDCSFENNGALRSGGAIFLRDNVKTSFEDSSFINNSAKEGGAIYWKSDSNENLTGCIFTGNLANQGSAIYLAKNNLEIINSVLLDNRAGSVELNLNVTRDGDEVIILADFKGNDNLINAIWNDGTIGLTNVTYLGADGITSTGSARKVPVKLEDNVKPEDINSIYQTQYEAGQNITFELYDNQGNLLIRESAKTNVSGVAKVTLNANADKVYEFVYHPDDNYYTGIENSTSKNIAVIEIPTADIYYLENETFIIHVRDKNNADEIPTGKVSVWLNDTFLGNFTLDNGKTVEISLADLKCGTYDVKVRYAGDDAFLPRENSTTFKVMKIASFIIATVENYTHGETGNIIIQVPKNEINTIDLVLNDQTYRIKVNESGYAEFPIPELDYGVYEVEFVYPETGNYLKSTNSTLFEIYPLINVNVVKSANVSEAYVLDLINFTITVSNDGQIAAHEVVVSDRISDDFVIVDYADGGKVLAGNEVSWNIDKLEINSKMSLWILVSPRMNCTFTNVATVKSAEAGVNKSNKVNVTVKPVVDLRITKKVNATEIYVGDEITYTIEVNNFGVCNATNVKVSEKLSKSLELISADTQYGDYDEDEGIWNIGNLNSLEMVSLRLTVKAISSGIIENEVAVTSDEKELNDSDNKYSCKNVTVSQRDAPIEIDVKNVTYGEAVTVTIKAPESSTGTLNVTVCGETYNDLSCDEGDWVFAYTHLAGGNYSVDVTFSGDNKYKPNSTHLSFNVAKLTPTINIEVADIIEGEIEVLNVTVNAPGSVNITVGGITVEIPLDESIVTTDVLQAGSAPKYDGKATWKLINLAKGTYDVYAVYNSNENYTGVSASDVFHVRAEINDVEVNVDDVDFGETASIEVKYPEDATGVVTLKVNGREYEKALKDGTATFAIPNLKPGHYRIEVSYEGDDKYLPNEAKGSFDVLKLTPHISAVKPKIKEGEIAKIIINLPKDAKGTVSLEIGGIYYYAPVQNGKAVFNIPDLKFGDYNIAIHYSGDDKYDDKYLFITLSVDLPDEDNHKNNSNHGISGYSAEKGLAKYPTANPIFVLLLAVSAIGVGQIRRFKKE
ncbi:Ig-like domain repeat protein [Methanobrevibacter sp.]